MLMASPSGRSRSYGSRDSRRSELVAAVELLLAEGNSFTELTVARITERAGLSRTAFYFHFSGPRELLVVAVQDIAAGLYTAFESSLDAGTEHLAELEAGLADVGRTCRQRASMVCAIAEVAGYDPVVCSQWRRPMERLAEVARRRLELAHPGTGRALQATALVCMTQSTMLELVATRGEDPDDVAAALAEVWWLALASGRRTSTPDHEARLSAGRAGSERDG
jgi:TetR/AcrR family transcriptional regulator, ethionamide resistance regulator